MLKCLQSVKHVVRINLRVISVSAEGASQNRRCFRIQKYWFGDSDTEIIKHTKDVYAKEMRFVYSFADVPHLMKIIRNFLFIIDLEEG